MTAGGPTTRSRTYAYDSLIVAAGAAQSYFGHDEFARFAPGMKTIDDALEIRGRIFGAFEMAETEADPEARRAWLTFVVVGGGPTGVEIAGQIAELARYGPHGQLPSHRPRRGRGRCSSTAATRSLRCSATGCRRRRPRELRRLGVTIQTEAMVTGVDAFGVDMRTTDGSIRASRLPDEGLGCRRTGVAAGWPARRGQRGDVRPRRSDRRAR